MTKNPTWGYAKDGAAHIFDLDDGEKLPKGWADTPAAYADSGESQPADKAFDGGVKAAQDGKDRSVPPAYRGKPEGERWAAGFDSVKSGG